MSVSVRFRVPASFVHVDLKAAPDELAQAWFPLNTDPAVSRHLKAFIVHMRESRALYAAMAVLPTGRSSYFAITEPAGTLPDLDTLAVRLATQRSAQPAKEPAVRLAERPAGLDEVREADLPCGRAIGVTEYATCTVGPGGRVILAVQEHAWIRHPAGRLIGFTLGTADDRRRPEHVQLFTDILSTVSFPNSPTETA